MHKTSRVKLAQPAKAKSKLDIHDSKIIICIWWYRKGAVYYERLESNEIFYAKRNR